MKRTPQPPDPKLSSISYQSLKISRDIVDLTLTQLQIARAEMDAILAAIKPPAPINVIESPTKEKPPEGAA